MTLQHDILSISASRVLLTCYKKFQFHSSSGSGLQNLVKLYPPPLELSSLIKAVVSPGSGLQNLVKLYPPPLELSSLINAVFNPGSRLPNPGGYSDLSWTGVWLKQWHACRDTYNITSHYNGHASVSAQELHFTTKRHSWNNGTHVETLSTSHHTTMDMLLSVPRNYTSLQKGMVETMACM